MRDICHKLLGSNSSDMLDQNKLRSMIIKVHSDPNLTSLEKAKLVQVRVCNTISCFSAVFAS